MIDVKLIQTDQTTKYIHKTKLMSTVYRTKNKGKKIRYTNTNRAYKTILRSAVNPFIENKHSKK